MPPTVSVLLPVYNGAAYLKAAINSVLAQDFGDFELVIINDGSADDSAAVIEQFQDGRIRYCEQTNRGLAATLNRGISLAQGKYIARQDQDDVSAPERLQRQVEFLDTHPEVGMVGAAAQIWVGDERSNRVLAHPTEDAEIKFDMLFDNYFVHSSVMVRREVFDAVGGYSEDKSRQPPEDYELWSRVIRRFKVANLPDVLITYREVSGSMSRTGVNPFLPNLLKISSENISWASGYSPESREVTALCKLSQGVLEGVPGGVGYAQLAGVVDAAAQGIAKASGVTVDLLDVAKRKRLRRLRYQYWNYRCGGLLGKAVRGKAGTFLRSLARR